MPPVKPEPLESSPDTKSQSINWLPDIKSETIGNLPDVKSETIEYTLDIPPTKRLKTLGSDSISPSSKGKSKITKEEEEDDDDDDDDFFPQVQLDTCGVCLLEEGMSLRGFIDSCEHYFCFVCIMEWAKVESRCPICKRRFSTIRRPLKDDVFPTERIVNIPVRNQVYLINGNATLGPSDPYSQVKCSICSLASDDSLLLLCDLCDSAAHSYCVGLGATVPEGDWFCKDCTRSKDEHAKIETDTTSDNNNNSNNSNTCSSSSNVVRFTRSNVLIIDIVRETSNHEPDTPSVSVSVNQSEPIAERSTTQSTVDRSNASNARTLKCCLNVHSRIQVLRENWDGFRGGLSFKESQRESTSQKHPNSDVSPDRGPYNIDRAWKMMDIAAKALGKKSGNKSSVLKDSKFPVKKERVPNEASKVKPNNNYFSGLKKHNGVETSRTNHHKPQSNQSYVEREFPSSRKIIASNGIGSSDRSTPLIRSSSMANDKCRVKNETDLNFGGVKEDPQFDSDTREIENAKISCEKRDRSTHLIRSSSIATDKCRVKNEIHPKFGGVKEVPQFDGITREIENAKSEIQSLVKLNLKLLSMDKTLDIDVFKEVARHATHSIMAACGIEPPKPRFRFFERLVCDHSETHKRPTSTLMTTSCRECFFVFVKDVVTAIAFDTTKSF